MHRVIEIIIKYRNVLLFIIYITLSLILLINNNSYQQSIYLTSANGIIASYNSKIAGIKGYLNLKSQNQQLQAENTTLQLQLLDAQAQLFDNQLTTDSVPHLHPKSIGNIDYTHAKAISATITNANNYITVNRGANQGIEPGMGVINHKGVIGIISAVGSNNSIAISILNSNFKISCKIKGSGYYGSLLWDGKSPQYVTLKEISTHANISKGDTIITSGFSSIFPEGITVGYVEDFHYNNNKTYYTVNVKLSADLSLLNRVSIVDVNGSKEINTLQTEINEQEKNKRR